MQHTPRCLDCVPPVPLPSLPDCAKVQVVLSPAPPDAEPPRKSWARVNPSRVLESARAEASRRARERWSTLRANVRRVPQLSSSAMPLRGGDASRWQRINISAVVRHGKAHTGSTSRRNSGDGGLVSRSHSVSSVMPRRCAREAGGGGEWGLAAWGSLRPCSG